MRKYICLILISLLALGFSFGYEGAKPYAEDIGSAFADFFEIFDGEDSSDQFEDLFYAAARQGSALNLSICSYSAENGQRNHFSSVSRETFNHSPPQPAVSS
jgi:hypothetical protein